MTFVARGPREAMEKPKGGNQDPSKAGNQDATVVSSVMEPTVAPSSTNVFLPFDVLSSVTSGTAIL